MFSRSRKLLRLSEKEEGLNEGESRATSSLRRFCKKFCSSQTTIFRDHHCFVSNWDFKWDAFLSKCSESLLSSQPFEDKADVLNVLKKKSVSLVVWCAAVLSTELLNLSINQQMLSRETRWSLSEHRWLKTACGHLVRAIRPKRNVAFEAPWRQKDEW